MDRETEDVVHQLLERIDFLEGDVKDLQDEVKRLKEGGSPLATKDRYNP